MKECRTGGHPLDQATEAACGELCFSCSTGEPRTELFGYLQHGTAPGPFRTERVRVNHEYADRYLVRYEGRWRRVYVGIKRCYIMYAGERITIQIDGL